MLQEPFYVLFKPHRPLHATEKAVPAVLEIMDASILSENGRF